jgi:predicted Zn-dependent protease
MGIYDDPGLQDHVSGLGESMAKVSERPELPWSFQVLDDPVINAFAAPGGFIYVSRGILAHCNSDAELAGILGHEIGHVTARHTVIKLSRAQLAQMGLGFLQQVFSDVENLGALTGIGMQLLFLKFSRNDELQADELGVRYMIRIGENPRRLIDVMEMLERVSRAYGGGSIPEWLSTHPSPGNRRVNLAAIIDPLDESSFKPEDRDVYFWRLNGLEYGRDPREGYTEGSLFLHPDLRFQYRFPEGWEIGNQKVAVFATSPGRDAAISISVSPHPDMETTVRDFFASPQIISEGARSIEVNGYAGQIGQFVYRTDQGMLNGEALFVNYGGRIYQIVGYGSANGWRGYETEIRQSMRSFAELNDPEALAVQPLRIEISTVRRSTTLQEYYDQRGCPVGLSELVLLNRLEPDAEIPQGSLIKWVIPGSQ